MSGHRAQQDDDKHDCSHNDMEAVKTRQHVKGRAINTITDGESRFAILMNLHADKDDTQENCQCQAEL